tara:strand:+ start:264 stop:1658 length:1395 start_codon:yes stop_codon:yes gene_type:complete
MSSQLGKLGKKGMRMGYNFISKGYLTASIESKWWQGKYYVIGATEEGNYQVEWHAVAHDPPKDKYIFNYQPKELRLFPYFSKTSNASWPKANGMGIFNKASSSWSAPDGKELTWRGFTRSGSDTFASAASASRPENISPLAGEPDVGINYPSTFANYFWGAWARKNTPGAGPTDKWYVGRIFYRFSGCQGHPHIEPVSSPMNQHYNSVSGSTTAANKSFNTHGYLQTPYGYDNRPPFGFEIVSASFWPNELGTANLNTRDFKVIAVACTDASWVTGSENEITSSTTVKHMNNINFDRPYSDPLILTSDIYDETDPVYGGKGARLHMNQNFIDDMNNNEFVDLVLMEYDWDYLGQTPISSSTSSGNSIYIDGEFHNTYNYWEGNYSRTIYTYKARGGGVSHDLTNSPGWHTDSYIQFVIKPKPSKIKINNGKVKLNNHNIYIGDTSKLDNLSIGGTSISTEGSTH